MITAKDFIEKYNEENDTTYSVYDTNVVFMIKFAKFHVKEALRAAADIPLKDVRVEYTGVRLGSYRMEKEVNKKAIKDCYPLEKIK